MPTSNAVIAATIRPLAVLSIATCLAAAGGCGYSSWDSMSGSTIKSGGSVDVVEDLDTRTFVSTMTADADNHIALRHVAGTITIRHGDVDMTTIESTVHADREYADLGTTVDALQWVKHDTPKGSYWTLSWPTDQHRVYHYQWADGGFELKSDRYDGAPVQIHTLTASDRPTMFVDLDITCPRGTSLDVRSLAGHITVGAYEGDLALSVLAGRLDVESCIGDLTMDAGPMKVSVGAVDGALAVDAGSGNVDVGTMRGSGVIDTGSGDIVVSNASGEALQVDAGSGNVMIGTLNLASTSVDTGSGNVTLGDGTSEAISVDTGSGRIRIEGATFNTLVCDTGSGGVTLINPLTNAATIDIETGSGGVTIYTDYDASFTLTADQGSGRLKVGFDDADVRGDGRRLTGATRGDGGTTINVDTGSGDCQILPRQSTAAAD